MWMIFLGLYLAGAAVIGLVMWLNSKGEQQRLFGSLVVGLGWPLWGVMAMLDGF